MKKKVFSIIGAAAVAGAMAFNVSMNSSGGFSSDIVLANVEALAKSEVLFGYTWIVTVYSTDRWDCNPGGTWCCPHPLGGCI